MVLWRFGVVWGVSMDRFISWYVRLSVKQHSKGLPYTVCIRL